MALLHPSAVQPGVRVLKPDSTFCPRKSDSETSLIFECELVMIELCHYAFWLVHAPSDVAQITFVMEGLLRVSGKVVLWMENHYSLRRSGYGFRQI